MSRLKRISRHLRRYRELYLTALALSLILYAERVLGPAVPRITADLVTAGVVTGLGLSACIGRKRRARIVHDAIADARAMLKDRINNQLQVVMTHLDPGPGGYAADRERLREVTQAVYAVSRVLDDLSPRAMRDWREET